MKIRSPVALAAFVLSCEAAGAVGSLFTFESIVSWYAFLRKPFFAPPNWIFAPVWIVLYALMGVAAYLVWEKGWQKKQVRDGLRLFGLQLALNVAWSFLFFGLKSPFLAFVDILLLLAAILLTIKAFLRVSSAAAWLMTPYAAWVAFASLLNLSVWLLN